MICVRLKKWTTQFVESGYFQQSGKDIILLKISKEETMKLLPKNNYDKVWNALKNVSINHLFARSVIEYHVAGTVWVDDVENPVTFYIRHPYGMSLLFGNTEQEDFNQGLTDYLLSTAKTGIEWLQAYPEQWDTKLRMLLGENLLKSEKDADLLYTDSVIRQTRVNFHFDPHKFKTCRPGTLPSNFSIVRTDAAIFESLEGSVIPSHFWDRSEDFLSRGMGFSLIHNDRAVSTAFVSFIHKPQVELGIETAKDYQGQGLAKYVCTALIDYCLANEYEPVWSCRLANTGSYKLAQQLGFEPTKLIPYYRLSYTGLPDLLKVDAYDAPVKL